METSLSSLRRELAEPLPHPDEPTLRRSAHQAIDWLLQHLATLPEQAVGRTASRSEMERLLLEAPPEEGCGFDHGLDEFQTKVAPFAFRINHPRFLAFIPSAPSFVSVLGDLLCAGTNFFSGVWLEASAPAQVELVVLDWFRTFLGLPASTRGILTSGGSEANLTALLVARESLSFAERARAVLYVSEQRHGSVDRAARIIGLRPDQIRPVPADHAFRLDASALRKVIRRDVAGEKHPWAVVANAGATNTGTVDPLPELASLCREHRLWFHVDAAYGWACVLTAAGRTALDGLAQADSLTLDPHKWFGQPYEAGCVLVRDGQRLTDTFAIRPDYMQDVVPASDEVNFADYGLTLTRRFRALKIWLSVKVLGLRWFRDLVERSCRLAEFAEALLTQSPHFEILSPRQLSIVCFRYLPAARRQREGRDAQLDQLNLSLADALRDTGRAFLSTTRLHGRVALRMCFVNWRTTGADVEEVIRLLLDLGDRLAAAATTSTRAERR
jgi:glutamate/tyrosine decarboxylase-like PLP-dependent enzyme